MAKVFRYIHFYRTLSCLLLFHIACTSTSLIAQPSDVYNAGVYTDFPFLPNIRPLDTAEINREIRRAAKLSATQTDSAFRLFQYTLVISSHMRYSDGIITSLKCISKIKVDQGYLEEAIFFYKKQIDYCIRHQGAAKYLASAYNNLGITLNMAGKSVQAGAYLYMAIKEVGSNKDATIKPEIIYANFGGMFIDAIGQRKKALYYLNKAEDLSTQHKNDKALGKILINKAHALAHLFGESGDSTYLEQAWKTLQDAQRLGRIQKDTFLQYNALVRLSLTSFSKYAEQDRLSYLKEAEHLLPQGAKNVDEKVYNLRIYGSVYTDIRTYAEAINYFTQAIKLSKKYNLLPQLPPIYEQIALTYSMSGKYKDAYIYLAASGKLKDSINIDKTQKSNAELEVKYRSLAKDREITEKKLMIIQQQKKIADKNRWVAISTSGSLVLLILGIGFFRNYRNRRRLQNKEIVLMAREREISMLKGIMKGEEKSVYASRESYTMALAAC